MTDPTGPPGGWAAEPRPPRTTELTAELAGRVAHRASVAGQGRPLVARLVLSGLLGVLVAWPRGVGVGAAVAVVLAVLIGVAPLALVRGRARRTVSTGDLRTTGYDREGRLVLEGAFLRTFPAGWARLVERRDGLAVVLPRARSVPSVVLPDELLTDDDVAFLTSEVAPEVLMTREVVVGPTLRRAARRAVLRNLLSGPMLAVATALVVLELVVAGAMPWPGPLVLAVVSFVLAAVVLVALLAAVVRGRYRPGRVLRSGVVGETLRLQGGSGLPAELPMRSVRSGRACGAVVRVRHGIGWVVVPTDLVPDDARPPARS